MNEGVMSGRKIAKTENQKRCNENNSNEIII
jgi:hypothetical protein